MASLKTKNWIIIAFHRKIFKLQENNNTLPNNIVHLLRNKRYQEIITINKTKLTILRASYKKQNSRNWTKNKIKKREKSVKWKKLARNHKECTWSKRYLLNKYSTQTASAVFIKKGSFSIPIPKEVNWFNLHQYFDKFTNQLKIKFIREID